MNTGDTDVIPKDQKRMLDKLRDLLEQQIEVIRKGEPAGKRIESLSMQAEVLVEKIKQANIPELAEYANQREQLKKLYDSLYMALSAQKADTKQQLNHIRKGKKILVTYRNNI